MQMKNYIIMFVFMSGNLLCTVFSNNNETKSRRNSSVQRNIDRMLPVISATTSRSGSYASSGQRRQSIYDRNGRRIRPMGSRFDPVSPNSKKPKRTTGLFKKKSVLELEARKLECLNELDDKKRAVKAAAQAARLLRMEFVAEEKRVLPQIEELQRQINRHRTLARSKTVRRRRTSLGDSVGY